MAGQIDRENEAGQEAQPGDPQPEGIGQKAERGTERRRREVDFEIASVEVLNH